MSGKYDPPDKATLLKGNPHVSSTTELMVAKAQAQFSEKAKAKEEASRATERQDPHSPAAQAQQALYPNLRRGRPRAVTASRTQLILDLVSKGETEQAACSQAGISSTCWCNAKRIDATLRDRVWEARDSWAQVKHVQYVATRYQSQIARAAGRKAIPPQPTRQAKWICHYLTVTVPLNLAAIPPGEIEAACARCNLSLESWERQERTFGLMKEVYQRRAKIRGQQPVMVPTFSSYSPQVEDDPFDVFRA